MLGSKPLIALFAFIIFYGTVTPMLGRLFLTDISSVFGRDVTLTGRTLVWEQLVPVAMGRPILGHGFGGFWTTEKREVYDISGSHNGYLDTILDLGFVGLILFSIFILSSCQKAIKEMNYDFDGACFKICFFLMTVLHNIAETSLENFASRLMAVVLLLVLSTTATSYTRRGL